jgi:hypothetical protein
MTIDLEFVRQFAGGEENFRKGEELTGDDRWKRYGQLEELIWGELKGSGNEPYQVSFSIAQLKGKCTCSSRQRPCKHIVALLLRYVNQAQPIKADPAPPWLQTLLKQQQKVVEKAKQSAVPASSISSASPEGEAPSSGQTKVDKRQQERQGLANTGIALLERWLEDGLRQGLLSMSQRDESFWADLIKRLIDCQLGGLANMVHDIATDCSGQIRFAVWLGKLARLHLLIRAYRQLHRLTPQQQEGVWSYLGRIYRKEEVVQRGAIRSGLWQWIGTSQSVNTRTGVTTRRYWLLGSDGRIATHDEHFHRFQSQQSDPWQPLANQAFEAHYVDYPALYPTRVLLLYRQIRSGSWEPAGYAGISELLQAYASALKQDPWLRQFPAVCRNCTVYVLDDQYLKLRDQYDYKVIIIRPSENFGSEWVKKVNETGCIFGWWKGWYFYPCSYWNGQNWDGMLDPSEEDANVPQPVPPWKKMEVFVEKAMNGTPDGLNLLRQAARVVLCELGGYQPQRGHQQ